MSRFRQIWVIALLCCAVIQCRRASEKPSEESRHRGLSETLRLTWKQEGVSGLDKEAVTRLAKAAFLSIRPPRAGANRFRLIGEMAVSEGQGALAFEARVSVIGLPFKVVARVAATGNGADKTQQTNIVTGALKDVAAALKELLSLVDADGERLTAALRSSEPDVQVLAARLIGHKKTEGAVKELCRLLKDQREIVAEAATESLIVLKDPSAVPCVIASIDKKSLRSEVRAIEVLGHVGGKEAIAYLEMTAGGHELQEVRQLSETLLKSLKNRN